MENSAESIHYNHVEYRRNLPHFQPDGAALFVTFRLHGTLPFASGKDGRAFAAADRELERAPHGPSWLKQPKIAEIVTEPFAMVSESAPCTPWSRSS